MPPFTTVTCRILPPTKAMEMVACACSALTVRVSSRMASLTQHLRTRPRPPTLGGRGRWCVDPDVIDQHRLREDYRAVRLDRGGAADGDIDQQEEIVVEDPWLPAQVRRSHRVIQLIVDIPADPAGFPADRVHVKIPARLPGPFFMFARTPR